MQYIYYGFERLIVNIFFIVIPLYLYQTFWVNKPIGTTKWTKVIYSSISIVSIYFCMYYPIHVTRTYTFDLSHIPFILGTLFGGFFVGLFLFLVTSLYLFIQGSPFLIINAIVMFFLLIIIAIIKNHYEDERNKPLLIASISFVSSLITIYLTNLFEHVAILKLGTSSLIYIIVQTISVWSIGVFIDTLMKNNRTEQNRMLLTEKLKTVSELSASISHEIRNPLTVTKGFLQLLLHRKDISASEQNYINLSLQELIRAEKMINNYLALAKPDETHLTLTDLKEDADYVISVINPYAAMNQVEIKSHYNNRLYIKCEQSKIKQALLNIMKNSVEAMTQGGILELNVSSHNNHIIIEIIDNGVGMTKEQIGRLGMPYYSTKSNGTGLGMSVVYKIFSQLQATIHIESHIGKGTCFTISIPANPHNHSIKNLQTETATSSKSLA